MKNVLRKKKLKKIWNFQIFVKNLIFLVGFKQYEEIPLEFYLLGCFEKLKKEDFKLLKKKKINENVFSVIENEQNLEDETFFECNKCQSNQVYSDVFFKKLPEIFIFSIKKENNFNENVMNTNFDHKFEIEKTKNILKEEMEDFEQKEKLPISIQNSKI